MKIEFDEIHIPTEKLDQVVEKNLSLIHKEHKKKQRYVVVSSAAAIAIILFGTFCFSHQALEARIPLLGHIFERVQDYQRYPGNFDEVAQPVEGNNVSESNGITFTLSEIYCDPQAMYVSCIVESENAFPDEALNSNILPNGTDSGSFYLLLKGEQTFDFLTLPEDYEWNLLQIEGEYADDHTFIGSFRIDFSMGPFEPAEKIPDRFHWEMQVSRIYYITDGYHAAGVGEWNFKTDVSVDFENTVVTEINEYAPNGEGYTTLTISPYDAFLDTTYDEAKVQPGYEEFDYIQSVFLDADGKYIYNKIGRFSPVGYNLSEITIYFFPPETNENYMDIQQKCRDEAFQPQLKEFMESISVHKIVVHPELPAELKK